MCCTGFCCFIQASICVSQTFFFCFILSLCTLGVWMVSLCCCCLTLSDFAFSLSLSSFRLLFGLAIKYSHGEMCVMHMCCWQRFISERIVSRKPFRTFVGVERALCYRFIPLSLSPSLSFQSISFAWCCIALKRKKNIIITN